MSDIFEIKKQDIFLKIAGVEHLVVDPPFAKRIELLKKGADLDAKKDSMNAMEFLIAANELNMENILLFLPTLSREDAEKVGGVELNAYLGKIMELIAQKFGAVFDKTEKK